MQTDNENLTQRRITVLLVDDQPIIGEAVKKMLESETDIDFHYCPDPLQAIPTANEIQPTVILQDLVMPQVSGMMLVKFYRANTQTKETPLIVLSSKEEAQTKAEAFALGANDYLVKLPEPAEMIARIRYHSRGYINLLERNEATAKLDAAYAAMSAELKEAADYVRALLPATMDESGIQSDWRFIPSSSLGGDAFGYHWIDEEHFAIYLLDVCGHGVGAALLSISAMNVLRNSALPGVDFVSPSSVLEGLNETFPMEKQGDKYFTAWYGVYNKTSRTLLYGSAGHPPALLYNHSDKPEELATPGMSIGWMPGIKYNEKAIELATGATLYVFSDGVYELTSPEGHLWEYAEFIDKLSNCPELDKLIAFSRDYQGMDEFEDDYSMLKLCFK